MQSLESYLQKEGNNLINLIQIDLMNDKACVFSLIVMYRLAYLKALVN